MALQIIPEWMSNLDDEDMAFIRRFLLASGSLKEMARQYGVTYPTVRLRLDRLIQKIRMNDSAESDPYIATIKRLALDDRLDFDTAKVLISEYKKPVQFVPVFCVKIRIFPKYIPFRCNYLTIFLVSAIIYE